MQGKFSPKCPLSFLKLLQNWWDQAFCGFNRPQLLAPCWIFFFFLLFSILVIFGGKRGRRRWWVKVGPKKRTLDPSRFYKNCNFWNIIQTLFFKLNYYLWWKCQQNQIIFMGVKPKKHQKRAISWILNHYTKRSKFLTWQTSNAIVMKLTTTVYFQKTFNLVKI